MRALTTNMQAAVVLLYVFLFSIVAALVVTVLSVSAGVRVVAVGSVVPLIVLTAVFIFLWEKENLEFCG